MNRIEWWKAIRASNLPARERLVALTLSTFMDPDGSRCWPAQSTVADAAGIGRRTAQRAITELHSAGYLELGRHAGPGEGRGQRPHLYRPAVPDQCATGDAEDERTSAPPNGAEVNTTSAPNRTTSAPPETDQCATGGAGPFHDLSKETPPSMGTDGSSYDKWKDRVFEDMRAHRNMPSKVLGRLSEDAESKKDLLRAELTKAFQAGHRPRDVAQAVVARGGWETVTVVSSVMAVRLREWLASNPKPGRDEGPALNSWLEPTTAQGGVFPTCQGSPTCTHNALWIERVNRTRLCDQHAKIHVDGCQAVVA